jgi:enoyl-CoA hydratase
VHPKPVIAALNGHTIAGGCMLSLACGHRIMVTDRGKISLNEITFGASVFAGSVEMLKSCVGHRNAETILLSGAMYSAKEAYRLGLVDRLSTSEDLMREALELSEEMATTDMSAYQSLKNLLRGPVAERMRRREGESIKEFIEIWYSESTRDKLKEIQIYG